MAVIKLRTLINEEYLAEYSLFPKNYNYDETFQYVKLAELLYIVPIIGQEMYNELLDQVENNTVTHDNALLLLLIYPYLGAVSFEVAVPMIAYRVNEVGITKHSSENSEPLDINELNYLTDYIRSTITPLKDKLEKFISDNKDLYPLIPTKDCCKCNKKSNAGRIYSFDKINIDVDGNSLYKTYNIINPIWGM